MAKLLGVTKGAVHQWTDEGRQVPAEHCPAIERITGGQVTCEQLNDKVDWAFVRSSRDSPAERGAPKGGKPKAGANESHPEAA
ncbi:putative antitoxin of bacterial toxin-antitoxin system, YdaS/YdaT [compost metagenome]